MHSVLIVVPSLVFFFISTHSVAHGGNPSSMRCYQGIHGDVPEELAKTMLNEFNITANADMVTILCSGVGANHCVQFECKGPGTKYFVFNTCHPRIYHPPYDFRKNKLKENCNNGKENDYSWCPNLLESLCNNLSIPQNKRPKPGEVVDPPPFICDGEMCRGGAVGLGASPAAICAVIAMLLLDHCIGLLRHYRRFD